MRDMVERHLPALPRLERVVLRERYGIGAPALSVEQVAEALGLSRMDVRRVEALALRAVKALEKEKA